MLLALMTTTVGIGAGTVTFINAPDNHGPAVHHIVEQPQFFIMNAPDTAAKNADIG